MEISLLKETSLSGKEREMRGFLNHKILLIEKLENLPFGEIFFVVNFLKEKSVS